MSWWSWGAPRARQRGTRVEPVFGSNGQVSWIRPGYEAPIRKAPLGRPQGFLGLQDMGRPSRSGMGQISRERKSAETIRSTEGPIQALMPVLAPWTSGSAMKIAKKKVQLQSQAEQQRIAAEERIELAKIAADLEAQKMLLQAQAMLEQMKVEQEIRERRAVQEAQMRREAAEERAAEQQAREYARAEAEASARAVREEERDRRAQEQARFLEEMEMRRQAAARGIRGLAGLGAMDPITGVADAIGAVAGALGTIVPQLLTTSKQRREQSAAAERQAEIAAKARLAEMQARSESNKALAMTALKGVAVVGGVLVGGKLLASLLAGRKAAPEKKKS